MSGCAYPPCELAGPFRYCPAKGCNWRAASERKSPEAERDRARLLARSLGAALRDEHASNCRCQTDGVGDCRTWLLITAAEAHFEVWPEPPRSGDTILQEGPQDE